MTENQSIRNQIIQKTKIRYLLNFKKVKQKQKIQSFKSILKWILRRKNNLQWY